MSGANEVLGCPGQGKSLFFVLKKIYVLRKEFKFCDSSPKISHDIFSHLGLPKIFIVIFFYKTGSLDAPARWMPGAVHHPHPLCTPMYEGLVNHTGCRFCVPYVAGE